MSVELVIDRLGPMLAMAILEDAALVDLVTAASGDAAVEDRFFLARVTAIEPAIDGAFLDLGEDQPGFLTGKDARYRRGLAKRVSIKHCVEAGEWLVVQGLRAAEGDKGARVTTDLKFIGRGLIFRPYGDEIIAARGVRAAERAAVQALGQELREATGLGGGLALRPLAQAMEKTALSAELAELANAWRQLAALPEAKTRRAGRLGFGPTPLARLLWRGLELFPARVSVADDALKAETRRLLESLPAAARPEFEALDGRATAFAATGVDAALAQAVAREVPLPGGGRLIIEETAACVAIDVDGGGRPALEANLEAAALLGGLVRLRNLGGTLIVDFIDLAAKQQRQRLEEALRRAFKSDPLPVQVYPMSPLGIVQISRAKRGGSPLRAVGRPCPACGGSGWQAESPQ